MRTWTSRATTRSAPSPIPSAEAWRLALPGGRARILVSLATLAGLCCGGRPREAVTVRDSVGITIVESHTPLWPDGRGWTLSREPVIEVGTAEGDVEYQFFHVEGALRLDDGRIVAADAGSSEIRFFDGEGRFITSTGRQGEAPGEYRQITALGRGPADSLWVYDFGLRRFTVLTDQGDAVRTVSLGGNLSAVGAVGRLSDGSFVVKENWSSAVQDASRPRAGLLRDPVAIARLSADGTELDTVATVAGREVFIGAEDGRGVMSAPLFAHTSSAVIRADSILVGDQEEFQILEYGADGTVAAMFRVPGMDLSITRAAIQTELESRLQAEPAERRAMARAHLEALTVPASRPAYSRIAVDVAGNIWAAEYTPYPRIPLRWTVLGADGELLGTVEMPAGFRVFDIGRDWILGVGRDESDVEELRLYRLEKAAGG